MLISVILIFIGLYTGEGVYPVIGFVFIFFLSVFVFMPGDITVPSGSNITVSYSYVNGSVTSNSIVVSDTYTAFNDSTSKWFARWLAIISAIGLILSGMEGIKSIRGKKDDD